MMPLGNWETDSTLAGVKKSTIRDAFSKKSMKDSLRNVPHRR